MYVHNITNESPPPSHFTPTEINRTQNGSLLLRHIIIVLIHGSIHFQRPLFNSPL